MLARLGFSIAVHCEPDILLLDEVLSVGDQDFQEKCIKKMLGFKRSGKTIVFVSHSEEQIKQICERILWIDQGEIGADGETEAIISDYLNKM